MHGRFAQRRRAARGKQFRTLRGPEVRGNLRGRRGIATLAMLVPPAGQPGCKARSRLPAFGRHPLPRLLSGTRSEIGYGIDPNGDGIHSAFPCARRELRRATREQGSEVGDQAPAPPGTKSRKAGRFGAGRHRVRSAVPSRFSWAPKACRKNVRGST